MAAPFKIRGCWVSLTLLARQCCRKADFLAGLTGIRDYSFNPTYAAEENCSVSTASLVNPFDIILYRYIVINAKSVTFSYSAVGKPFVLREILFYARIFF